MFSSDDPQHQTNTRTLLQSLRLHHNQRKETNARIRDEMDSSNYASITLLMKELKYASLDSSVINQYFWINCER
ncbi:hypothetical protein KIN20_003431 [Parelaphostrongylus tenuis]|uniref:Uncharacterized protein n=1 Tax=Parelaphostrongylus tenuis TaxID=148309 RepID=A0AAD5M1F6_PARTN|nr:hypothetical protein KIN20_003431 [Parelaphostrongylus tenuis]